MALRKTTVLVDEEYLEIVKAAAAREGRPASEYFREAFRIVALRAQRWGGDWDVPEVRFGRPVSEDEVCGRPPGMQRTVSGDSPSCDV